MRTKIKTYDISKIKIGKGTSINEFTTIIVANDINVEAIFVDSFIEIGENTYIGEYNNIRAGGGKILIGNNCSISQHITIVASNHSIKKNDLVNKQKWSTKNNFVIIEDDVWIGANSVILPGVIIGKGAVVGSGSIVTNNIPEYAIVCGNPAVIMKYRE